MSSSGVILLVEDNADDEELTVRALRKANVANGIDVVRDGAQALDYLQCRGEYAGRDPATSPDVVLLDLRLPKVSGLEVLRAVRADPRLHLQPVVILTSSDMEEDIREAYKLGANSFVTKPVLFQQFAEAVARVGLYWTLVNRQPTQGRSE